MTSNLPSPVALRAFEAAARHLSFTTAADELNVTQAAISHQVKALEQWLGVPLFRRLNRALLLTDAGQNYAPPLGDAFDELAGATDRLRADDNRTDWTVWFLADDIQGGDPTRGPGFTDSSLVLQAADEGQGVDLGVGVRPGQPR